MVFTADDGPGPAAAALAVEPMTAPPDAFRSGARPGHARAGREPGDEFSVSWGIRTLE